MRFFFGWDIQYLRDCKMKILILGNKQSTIEILKNRMEKTKFMK